MKQINKQTNNNNVWILRVSFLCVFLAVVTCPSLPVPSSGAVVYSSPGPDSYEVGATAMYSCNTGYGISGDQTRTCGSDGTWSGTGTFCVGQ